MALALIGRPEVAFLDEPTAGVDPEGRIAIRAVVAGLKDKGVCTLLTTHELGEAERVADRIAIMSAGRIVREGTPHESSPQIRAHRLGRTAQLRSRSPSAPRPGSTWDAAAEVGPGASVTETAAGRYRLEAGDARQPGCARRRSPRSSPSAAPP